ncbi:MAG TPA: hypothetical protein VIL74_08495 [Pyrinomonadaceae bacterium]|jgi:hypothetical protein
MKRFLSSVALCGALLFLGLFFLMPSIGAQDNVLPALLNLPAPPPPNPFYRSPLADRDENFLDKKNPPPGDAPIEDLLDYWKHQNQFDRKYTYAPQPDERTIERLMAEVEKKPQTLAELVGVFPETKETAEFVKRLYDEESANRRFDQSWRTAVKKWLTYHSPYFSNELFQTANQAADTEEYVTNQDEVLALARVDWEKAKPLLDRMLGNARAPVSQTLARWAYYKHALAANDELDIDKYRKELQETVENESLQPGNRDLAMDALVEAGDFPGRDEWYYSLLEDETLYELRVGGQVYTGLTTLINHSPGDKYVAKMIELAGSANQTVRNAAVRNLSVLLDANKNPEIIRALVPWLENPKWAKEVSGERMKIVNALRNFAIPESVPGLIAMLNEKQRTTAFIPDANGNTELPTMRSSNTNAAPNVSANYRTQAVESYPYRSYAIMALEKQRSPLAAAPLRQLIAAAENWERQAIVRAALVSNGFTIGEQVEALEAIVKNFSEAPTTTNAAVTNSAAGAVTDNPPLTYTAVNTVSSEPVLVRTQNSDANDLRMILGQQLTIIDDPSDELVKAVIERIALHEKRNPPLASALRNIVQNWKGAAINALLLRDLRDGKSNVFAVLKLLVLREQLREKQLNEVLDVRSGSATALGIAACLLEQTDEYDALLSGDNAEAKTALLGCARLIRAPLAVQKVAAELQSPNKLLALAAERYLEAEDSPAARALVLARHPDEARILGARTAFLPDGVGETSLTSIRSMPLTRELFISVDRKFEKFEPYFFNDYSNDAETEAALRAEIKKDAGLFGVYAYDRNLVKIYQDRAVFSWQDDPARYRERILSAEEFEALKNFLAAARVDELPPFLSGCPNCQGKQLLMLGKGGGRRVFVKAEPLPQFFADLEGIFAEFRKTPARIHYHLEKSVAGFEILFADDNQSVTTLWKNGADFRLLIDDLVLRRQYEKEPEESNAEQADVDNIAEESIDGDGEKDEMMPEEKAAREKARAEELRFARQKQYGSYAWYRFDKTKLLEPVAQPAGVEFIPLADGFAVQPNEQQWKGRAANVEVRGDEEGLYKIKNGHLTKIGAGYYYQPLVTPNGRWAVAGKYSADDDYQLVRVNLLTGREFKVKAAGEYDAAETVANVPALNRVLLFSSYGENEAETGERAGEFMLLDPETGVVQPVSGEARPLLQQTFRPLQPVAGVSDLFWAALPDREKNATEFGVYNAKTLVFKPLLALPRIVFNSLDMWVDEGESKFYFVYEGHLLSAPLPNRTK